MSTTTPVYIQIHNTIKQEIEAGKWHVGDRIPSERELSIQFNVSRMTLRQAIQTLVDDGILERRVGSGTYVSPKKVTEQMAGIESFTDIMLSQGRVPSSKTVSYFIKPASVSEAERLKLANEELVLRMERVRYGDRIPICFEVAIIPYKFIQNLSKKEITTSLYKAVEKEVGRSIGKAEQTITAMLATEQISENLAIKKGSPLLRLRQITYFDSGEPFEYVSTQYVAERFQFYLEKNN